MMIFALALLAVPGIVEGQAHDAPGLFSAVPPDTGAPESLNARDAYATGSEMAVLNTVSSHGGCRVIPSV